jgi:hypothetical protein
MASISAIVSEVEGKVKTVVGWLAKQFQKVYAKEPQIQQVVDAVVPYAEAGLDIILATSGEAAAVPEVNAVINEAQSDLKVVSALIYDFGPTPNASSIAAAVQANLASLETAGHIKDPATLAKLKLIINAVGNLSEIIAKLAAA